MSLQWYPGHMTKARAELARLMPSQDVVIEVLDARLPLSSSNPLVTELRKQKPCIKVLTKSDLADPTVTKAWLRHFQSEPNVTAFAATTTRPEEIRKRIATLTQGLAKHRGPLKPVRALIAGVPNVGKSTLINTLASRAVAAVGNKPAVTKTLQAVTLKTGMVITDSPGIMWPKIEDEAGALRLAFAGSIPDTAIDYLAVGTFGAEFLLRRYPKQVMSRYALQTRPVGPESLLTEIGRTRGTLRGGGDVELHRAAEILVHEFRAGLIGMFSLEEP
ncbi:MAG: ribosome biogenesis GTPase YlqF [Myxococcaceae bacterium]